MKRHALSVSLKSTAVTLNGTTTTNRYGGTASLVRTGDSSGGMGGGPTATDDG